MSDTTNIEGAEYAEIVAIDLVFDKAGALLGLDGPNEGGLHSEAADNYWSYTEQEWVKGHELVDSGAEVDLSHSADVARYLAAFAELRTLTAQLYPATPNNAKRDIAQLLRRVFGYLSCGEQLDRYLAEGSTVAKTTDRQQ